MAAVVGIKQNTGLYILPGVTSWPVAITLVAYQRKKASAEEVGHKKAHFRGSFSLVVFILATSPRCTPASP